MTDRTPAAWLAAIVVGLLAGTWVLTALQDDDDDAPRALLDDPAAPTRAQRAPDLEPAPPRPAQPLPAVASAPVPEPAVEMPPAATTAVESLDVVPHEMRSWNPGRQYVPDEVFEAFYADATVDVLGGAKARLSARVSQMITEASTRLLDQGLADERVRGNAEDRVDVDEAIATALARTAPPPDRQATQGLISTSRTQSNADGTFLSEEITLQWADASALYDTHDELIWVSRQLKAAIQAESHK